MKAVVFGLSLAVIGGAATTSSATTLDFDSGSATILNNVLSQYSQDGLTFSVAQSGAGSIGANLFNTLYCVNQTGDAAKCDGNDDGDLVPRVQGQNGVAGNILIRQESHNVGNRNGLLDDDASTAGFIRFTLISGSAFRILSFGAVDEQPMQIEVGQEVCGPVDNMGNRDTGRVSCESSLTSLIGVGESFDVRFAGSGGVDSIELIATPLPAGLSLLLTGLGIFAFWRRRRPVSIQPN